MFASFAVASVVAGAFTARGTPCADRTRRSRASCRAPNRKNFPKNFLHRKKISVLRVRVGARSRIVIGIDARRDPRARVARATRRVASRLCAQRRARSRRATSLLLLATADGRPCRVVLEPSPILFCALFQSL
jgi:hypothetical protein